MSSKEDVSERLASLSVGALPYKTFLSDLSGTSPALQTMELLSLGPEATIDRSDAIAKFSLLLSTLRVPGPCEVWGHHRISPLGQGAQFTVVKQDVTGLTGSKIAVPGFKNSVSSAAVKTPLVFLDGQQKLDLSSPRVSRQVRNMILEITALCHPRLRDHGNFVDLLGWGTHDKTRLEVPFLVLEVANNTLATFLCESESTQIALRHHISLDIGCGLDALHEIGLIHGDLKPENVLMFHEAGHWVAKLADFGGGVDTGQGGILEGRGTVGWRAPELRQLFDDGTHIDRSLLDKIDSYSYGLLLWSMFLKDKGSAPCAETAEAEMVALSELESNHMSLPISLQSALKSSLSLLLKQDPKIRTGKMGHLLDDGSQVYSEWMLLKSSESRPFAQDNTAVALPQGHDVRYDWEIPQISFHYAETLRSAFLRDESMTTEVIQSLFMAYAGSRRLAHYNDSQVKYFVLDLLNTGGGRGSQLLRALIYTVHEYFQIQPRADLCDSKLLWMSEAVASGAFFLRKPLKNLNNSLFEKSIRTFQDRGGYNQLYAALDPETIAGILMHTSLENIIHLDRKKSLNSRGDKLLHILSSATASEDLKNIVNLMNPQEVNALNDRGETALYRACMAGWAANVLLLLSHGADPSIVPSHSGPTCLHWLFHFNPRDVDVVARELVTHGAPIHSQVKWKVPMLHYPFTLPMGTPLHWAVENSAVEATRSLLRHGADPSVRDGSDPYAYDDNVRYLDMWHPSNWTPYSVAEHTTLGFNAVDVAVKNRDHEILAMLLSNDTSFDPGDTDEEGYSAVQRLDAGEWRYTNHGSAIWCRLFQGSPSSQADSLKKTIAILLQHGFKLDKLTNQKKRSDSALGFSSQTALMIAVAKGSTETVKQLLDAGADVNVTNSEGETALLSFTEYHVEEEGQQSKVVSLLLDANAHLHARNSRNDTPFIWAASSGLCEVAAALLNHGADLRDRVMDTPQRVAFGQTALAKIAKCPLDRTVKHDEWLVTQLKAHVLPRIAAADGLALRDEILEKADLDGGTLLHYAAGVGLARSCAILLEAKVSINSVRRRVKSRRGGRVVSYRTPLDEALKSAKALRRYESGAYSEEERANLIAVLSETAKLLKDAGGVESKLLIAKRFMVPPYTHPDSQPNRNYW